MSVDWLIFAMAIFVGIFRQGALVVAIWLISNVYLSSIINVSSGWSYWTSMTDWAFYFYAKDFALVLLAGFLRLNPLIFICFAASAIFHIFASWQINTFDWEKVTLFEYRSDCMLYLSVIMLATVSSIGSGTNGGRRVRTPLLNRYNMRYNLLCYSRYKART